MINYFKIKKILAKDTLPIRQLVLRDGKIPVKHCEFEDDNNPFSFHLGAVTENKIIGIISILNQSSSISKISNSLFLNSNIFFSISFDFDEILKFVLLIDGISKFSIIFS